MRMVKVELMSNLLEVFRQKVIAIESLKLNLNLNYQSVTYELTVTD